MGLNELDALSKSYGLANALLIVGVAGLLYAVRTLYRQNNALHDRLEQLSAERVKALETLVADEGSRTNTGNPHP